jgi:hypothetical protein
MKSWLRVTIVAAWVGGGLAAVGCGGEGELGEECGEEGIEEGECAEGLICGKPDDGSVLECLTICEEQADCPSDEECNGVSGSDRKACRPKDGGGKVK